MLALSRNQRACITLVACITLAVAALNSLEHARAQEVRGSLQLLTLESRVFDNSRFLRIWLPEGYDDEENISHRYPVLYLNDGQDLFDAATAVLGSDEWQVDETTTDLISAGAISPMIIVGIDNAGRAQRPYEYLPYPDEFLIPPEPSPAGNRYALFLETEVIPFVDDRFRTRREADSRALGGSSYGALISLYVAVTRPNLFSRLLLESPSFYVDNNRVLNDASRASLNLERVYLGVGTNELALDNCPEHPGNAEAVSGVRRLADILADSGMPADQLHVLIETCAVHSQVAWARRFPVALRFLFGN
jgi:predicted alpha/beta superfamily hydrolase